MSEWNIVPDGACVVCDGFGCEHCPDVNSRLSEPRKYVPKPLLDATRCECYPANKKCPSAVVCAKDNESKQPHLSVTVTFRFHNETHLREFIRGIRQHPNVESVD